MSGVQKLWRLSALLLMLAFALAGCGVPELSALKPSGPVAEEQLWLIGFALAIMIFVFLVVIVIWTFVLVKYRKRPGQTGIPKQVEGNHTLEVIWTVIPIILLLVLAVPTVATTYSLAKDYSNDKDAIQVKVIGHQFWWEFEYPKLQVNTGQELVVPAGKKINFELTSADVIHAFWVPAIAGKQDNIPGDVNKMWFEADKPGIYYGRCAELCGASHALMDFRVRVVEQAEFDKWVANMKNPKEVVLSEAAQKGQEVFKQNCMGCHAVQGTQKSPVAPNLTDFADRDALIGYMKNDLNLKHDPEQKGEKLKAWIKNPLEFKEQAKMPAFGDKLSEEDLNNLVEYMKTLSVKE
jgi:cytochrome c oxidase subunit 2